MTATEFPRQADFDVVSEAWGRITLNDGSIIETRIILSDIVILGEDILGPQLIVSHVVAIRAKSKPELKEEVMNSPLLPPGTSIPLTSEEGYETIDIENVDIPTRSVYSFNGYTITVELNTQAVARTLSYRVASGSPLYNVRWSVISNVKKVSEPQ